MLYIIIDLPRPRPKLRPGLMRTKLYDLYFYPHNTIMCGTQDKINLKLKCDKEEVCTPLRSYQVQVYTREEKTMLIGNVRIVTSKMSCALVIDRESCAVTLSETSTREEVKELLDLWQQKCRQSYSIG